MSADSCVAYLGVRYNLTSNEVEQLEARTDARQLAAKSVGLKTYWGNFGGEVDHHVLFIGTEIGVLGPENDQFLSLSIAEISAVAAQTADRLRQADLCGEVRLYLEWSSDA